MELRKHSIVKIENQVCQLTTNPRKFYDGWIIRYRTEVGGAIFATYIDKNEMEEITK